MPKLACATILLFQFHILFAQNTGIGTISPIEKLEVNGAIKIGTTSLANPGTIRYNSGIFEGMNNLLRWETLGLPANSLITVSDTTGFLGHGYSIYGKQAVNMQSNLGLVPGTWQTPVSAPAGVFFTNVAGVWTGSEILVYYNNFIYRLNTTTNIWTQSSLNTVGGFQTRFGYSAVWTGSEIIIFGGFNGPTALNNGVRYNPTTNTWTAIANAPVRRIDHSAIFKGTEMIVFGGDSVNTSGPCTGAGFSSNQIWKYDIVSNTWTGPIAVTGTVPSARRDHISVWTGTEMLVFGGSRTTDGTCNGGGILLSDTYSFNLATNVWTQKASGAQFGSTIGVWSGSKMLIWGSNIVDGFGYSIGYAYDPVANLWSLFPNENAIYNPGNTFAIWNGIGMYVVEGGGYQVFDPAAGFSNLYYFPTRQTFYILRKN